MGNLPETIKLRDQLSENYSRAEPASDLSICLRWTERAIGLLVKRGQSGPDRWIQGKGKVEPHLVSAKQFFRNSDERSAANIFAEQSEEVFANAIAEALKTGKVTRAEVQYQLTKRPPDWVRDYDRPAVARKTRRIKVEEVIDKSIETMHSVFAGIEGVLEREHYEAIDAVDAKRYEAELSDIVGHVRTLRKRIKNGQ
jgi:hypothetical protein